MVSDEMVKEINEEKLRIAYMNGIIEGLKMYAFYKNGIQYVGAFNVSLQQAIEKVEKKYRI
jgi:hypothetical protein